jgi:hypothetical protein
MGLDITGLGSVFDFASKVIDKIFPDKDAADKAKLAMLELQQKGEFKQLENDFNLAMEQIKVNAVEAANPSLFVSGWRPAVGWVCVFTFAFNYVFLPLANFSLDLYGIKVDIIALDTGELWTLLGGLLGIGGLRTVEKVKGVTK